MAEENQPEVEEAEALFEENDSSCVIDMNQVKEATFEVLPKGTYTCIIESAEYGLSKEAQKPMWTLILAIVDGEYANRKLFNWISFSEKALPMSKATIMRIAPELLSATFDPKEIAEAGSLVGKEVRAKVVIKKYEGDDSNSVKELLAAKVGGDDFLDAA